MGICEYLGGSVLVECVRNLGCGKMDFPLMKRHKCTLKERWSCTYEGIEHLCPLRKKTMEVTEEEKCKSA